MLTISRRLENSAINVTEVRRYLREEIPDYIHIFNNYRQAGTILSDTEFESSFWRIKTGVSIFGVKFRFNEISFIKQKKMRKILFDYIDLMIAVKSFALLMLYKMSGTSVVNFIRELIKLIRETDYFNPDKLKEYQERKSREGDKNLIYIIDFLLYFEDFTVDKGYYEEFENKLLVSYGTGRKTRILPTFESMFRYEDIIREFIKKWSPEEKEEFFPVVLWWIITTIIPIRSTEFSITPWDCTSYENGHYYLKIYRSSIKGGRLGRKTVFGHDFNSCYKLHNVQINKNIYDLIEEYKSIVDKYDYIKDFYGNGTSEVGRREFLLSQRSHLLFLDKPKTTINQKYELEYLSVKQLYQILEKFLYEIVYKQFGVEVVPKTENIDGNGISKIQFMDTRHFAIINMVMLGYEPATIQKIAGHEDIHSSFHYYNHLDIYTNCYIISVAKHMAYEKNSEAKLGIMNASYQKLYESLGNANMRYKQVIGKDINQANKFRKISGGWCDYEQNDIIPCLAFRGNHARCKHFIPDNKGLIEIEKDFEKVGKLLSSELRIIETLIKNHKKINDFSKRYNVELEKIRNYAEDRARVLSDYIILGCDDEPIDM